LVVDDDLLVAEAFVFALVQRGFSARFAVPATLAHVRDAIGWGPHLALLDVDLVEGDPVSFVELFRQSGVTVAVMGNMSQRELLLKCSDAGAAAVVNSNKPLEDLVQLLERLLPQPAVDEPGQRSVRQGSSPMTSRFAPFAILTPREQSVLAKLMDGRTADAIAKEGWVALSTVRSQIKSILQKLGVNSQLAAVAMARQAGWRYVEGAARPARSTNHRGIDPVEEISAERSAESSAAG
jgi:DNA-binding NarL/FixJ family response regulator